MDVGALLVYITAMLAQIFDQSSAGKGSRGGSRRRRLTAEEQLMMDLFRGYDTDARGVINTSYTVTVDIQFLLLRIQRLDERSQVLMTTGLVLTEWKDERLTWDPTLYSGIRDVVIHANRIWTPELAIINGADEMIQEFEKIRVLIAHDGKVHWEPGGVFQTTCDLDITYFPFDSQSCHVEIGAWAYKSSRMNLTTSTPFVELGQFSVNGEWKMMGTSSSWVEVVLPCCLDIRYSKVVFTLHMDRRAKFYVMNIMLPCVLLSSLILIVFCVPPDAGEKISAGISVLLAFTVFLLMLADNIPRTSLDVPILVIYLGTTMALGTASVILTVFVLNLHHRGSHTPVARWARVAFLYHCARLFGLPEVPLMSSAQRRKLYVGSKPNNFKGDEADAMEMVEIQHILTPNDRTSPGSTRRVSDNNLLLSEAMHYHKVDLGVTGASQVPSPSVSNAARATKEEALRLLRYGEIIKEWQLLARVLDRIFFCLVFTIMVSCAVFILSSPWYMSDTGRFK